MKNKALQNTKSSQTMENTTPSGLYKNNQSTNNTAKIYKDVVKRIKAHLVDIYIKDVDRVFVVDNVWILTLLRLYFYRGGELVVHPRYMQVSHHEIINNLPNTPAGMRIRAHAFNADGSLSTWYKDLVRRCTYHSRPFGKRQADPPERAKLTPFEVFQPDRRTAQEKKEGKGRWERNIYRLTEEARQLLEKKFGDLDALEKVLGASTPPEIQERTPSKPRNPRHPRRRTYHDEPKWVEEQYNTQSDPQYDLHPELDETLPWPPEVRQAHQDQIARQVQEAAELRRLEKLRIAEYIKSQQNQCVNAIVGSVLENPVENLRKTGVTEDGIPSSTEGKDLRSLLGRNQDPPYPPLAVDNSPSPEPPNDPDFKTASKGDVVATIDNIEIAKPSSLPSTADLSNTSLDSISSEKKNLLELSTIQKSESHTNLPITQTTNNHKLPTKFLGDGNKQQSSPKPRLSPAEELASLVAFVATYGSGSARWIEALKRQLGPNPPPPSPDVPFYPPHLQVSGIPRVVPKHNPYQPRGHPEDHRFGFSPAHRLKGKNDGFP